MTTGINGNYGYNPYLLDYNIIGNQNNPGLLNPTIFTPGATPTLTPTIFTPGYVPTTAPTTQPDNTADGKDDGKIGFWGALKNIGKGILKTITSPFTDEQGKFSLWKTIKSVAIGTAIALIPGGPAIALAAGTIFGGVGVASAAYRIATAKTDAEDEAAWQSLGGSATVLAASVYGAKQYGSAQAGESVSAWKGVKSVFSDAKATVSNAWTAIKNQSPATLWNKGVNAYSVVKGKVVDGWKAMENTPPSEVLLNAADKVHNKFNSSALKDLANTSFKDMFAKITSLAKDSVKNGSSAVRTMSPARQALVLGTLGITGRTSYVPDFYGQLSTQEQVYFDSLPEEQKQALIDQYYAIAA